MSVNIYIQAYITYFAIYSPLSIYIDAQEIDNIASGGEKLGSGDTEVRERFTMYTLCYLLNFEPLGSYLFF